jgi:hypothetical protein
MSAENGVCVVARMEEPEKVGVCGVYERRSSNVGMGFGFSSSPWCYDIAIALDVRLQYDSSL